jgi:uncharacterized protein (TIGR03437 family)
LLACAAFSQTRGRLDEYALVLEDEPVARRVQSRAALRGSEGSAVAVRIRAAQSGLIGDLRRRGVAVTGATQTLVNAITVSATRETALELGKLPGVRYVIRAPKVRPNLDRATEASNVQAAYAAVGGAGQAGAGVKIGIIDSGMDLTHPGLQDTSLTPPAGYPKGNTTYTNRKVIVARSYIGEHLAPGFTADRANTDPAAISQPDDDTPRDFIGHGTALAMIAAGASNTNAANGITIQGVAPKAFLGNYKIFGSPGLNDFSAFRAVEHALTDAIADGMDVVTLSLSEGDPAFFAPLDTQTECGGICDIYAQAVENTVRAGVVVVVSAGNSGNIGIRPQTWSSVHSPGTAPSGITVGALVNSREMYQSVRRADGQTILARFGTGPQLMAPLAAPVRDGGLGCSAFAAGSMAGAIALIQRGDCYIDEKVNFAQQAGAVAVIVYQASGDDILSGLLPAATSGIPSVLIGNADGVALRVAGGTVTLDPAFTGAEATGNAVWPASSRGPSPGDFGNNKTNVIKPEIAAVGANIYTAAQRLNPSGAAYNASGYTSVTGTSYATAVVAGAAALVKQKNPGWTPAQIKSAVVNTANQDVTDSGAPASVRSVGAGRLNVGDAVNATFTASPATISFGVIAAASLPIGRTLTISNGGTAAVSLTLSVAPRTADANARVQLGSTAVTVGAGGTDSVTATLTGTRPAPGSYEGFIEIRGGSQTLRVPYLYVVGDGVPADLFSVGNGFFVGGVGDRGWEIDLRATDQYGVPVVGTQVRFSVVSGGGAISAGDDRTFLLGNSAALVNLSATPGEHVFRGTVGGPAGPFLDFVGLARPYPAISEGGVVNAASNTPGVAAGSYVSIYGNALADAVQVERTPYLPVTLSSASVTFDADGISLPGKLHFVSPGQVNAQVPWEFEGKGSVKVKVWMDYLPSNVLTVPLNQYAPGFFEVSGLVAAQDAAFNLITRERPARRGQVVQLYVNGLGPVTNRPASGEPTGTTGFSTTLVPPTVTIGGREAQAIFSGLTPGVVGLYQVNAILAADTPTGDQPIVVTIGGASSKASVIPVQ